MNDFNLSSLIFLGIMWILIIAFAESVSASSYDPPAGGKPPQNYNSNYNSPRGYGGEGGNGYGYGGDASSKASAGAQAGAAAIGINHNDVSGINRQGQDQSLTNSNSVSGRNEQSLTNTNTNDLSNSANVSGRNTNRVNQSQGNRQQMVYQESNGQHYSGGYTVKSNPNVALSTPPSTAPCYVALGASVSVPGLGLAANGAIYDRECEVRQTVLMALTYGDQEAVVKGNWVLINRLDKYLDQDEEEFAKTQTADTEPKSTSWSWMSE